MSIEDKIIIAVFGKPLNEGMPRPNFVNKIIKAFEEEGWVKPLFNVVNIEELRADPKYNSNYMTGKEWYERFEKEVNREFPDMRVSPFKNYGQLIADHVLRAGKRAAGVEDEA